ncbi:Hypothetical protein PBC10988_4040 [Planctomycetales bacterium 10988]|nr:Hypothetical protein PBC10988_4040 [Planctomycetales bacterium 10988]
MMDRKQSYLVQPFFLSLLVFTLLGVSAFAQSSYQPPHLLPTQGLQAEPLQSDRHLMRELTKPHVQSARQQFPVPWETLGHSREGRPIQYATFGEGQYKVLVLGPFQGDEIAALEFVDQLAIYLDRSRNQLGDRSIRVIRLPNPDGFVQGVRGNVHGVEINRNFPARNWQQISGGTHWISGTRPASEPETQLLMQEIERWKPGRIILLNADSNRPEIGWAGASHLLAQTLAMKAEIPMARKGEHWISGSLAAYYGAERQIPLLSLTFPSGNFQSFQTERGRVTTPQHTQTAERWQKFGPIALSALELSPQTLPDSRRPEPATNGGLSKAPQVTYYRPQAPSSSQMNQYRQNLIPQPVPGQRSTPEGQTPSMLAGTPAPNAENPNTQIPAQSPAMPDRLPALGPNYRQPEPNLTAEKPSEPQGPRAPTHSVSTPIPSREPATPTTNRRWENNFVQPKEVVNPFDGVAQTPPPTKPSARLPMQKSEAPPAASRGDARPFWEFNQGSEETPTASQPPVERRPSPNPEVNQTPPTIEIVPVAPLVPLNASKANSPMASSESGQNAQFVSSEKEIPDPMEGPRLLRLPPIDRVQPRAKIEKLPEEEMPAHLPKPIPYYYQKTDQ